MALQAEMKNASAALSQFVDLGNSWLCIRLSRWIAMTPQSFSTMGEASRSALQWVPEPMQLKKTRVSTEERQQHFLQ